MSRSSLTRRREVFISFDYVARRSARPCGTDSTASRNGAALIQRFSRSWPWSRRTKPVVRTIGASWGAGMFTRRHDVQLLLDRFQSRFDPSGIVPRVGDRIQATRRGRVRGAIAGSTATARTARSAVRPAGRATTTAGRVPVVRGLLATTASVCRIAVGIRCGKIIPSDVSGATCVIGGVTRLMHTPDRTEHGIVGPWDDSRLTRCRQPDSHTTSQQHCKSGKTRHF